MDDFITPIHFTGQAFYHNKPVIVLLYKLIPETDNYPAEEWFLIAPHEGHNLTLKGPAVWVPMEKVEWR